MAGARAVTFTVTTTADGGAGSFRQAIADAQENDAINFAPKVRGTIALTSGELLISKALAIQGPGADLLTIDAGNASRVLRIDAHGKTVSIFGLTFTRGYRRGGDNEGGGIRNDSNLTLTACTVSACGSAGDDFGFSGKGGGIYNTGASSIQLGGCTLQDNHASGGPGFHGGSGGSGDGGALWNDQGTMASWQNCTITGNTAAGGSGSCIGIFCGSTGSGSGAGIYNAGNLAVTACTIASNSGSSGGGGIWSAGTSRIGNSIVAGNSGGGSPDASGSFVSDGFNLIGKRDGSAGFTAISDQTGTIAAPLDPKLGPLQDNGGSTWTRALLQGSPAIDAGTSVNLSSDQRGAARTHDYPDVPNAPGGDGTDIGSFESGSVTSRLANISTRARVGTGDNVMIGGFIITGTEVKTVLVRGIGPSVPLPNVLPDPLIEVYSGDGVLRGTNDNWKDAATQKEIMDSGLAPTNDLEAALLGVISPGAYTVVVRDKNNTPGTGLFEVYDLQQPANSRLANISTRGFVETGDNVLIGGTIVTGNGPATVLVRAIGPSLTNAGVSNALQDPRLDLYNSQGDIIASDDNWKDFQKEEIEATMIPPNDDRESAILRTLPPGQYTMIVRGATGTAGVAVVEAYQLND